MTAAHGQTGNSAGRGLCNSAEVLLNEGNDFRAEADHITVHELVALCLAHLSHSFAVPAHLHLLLGNTEGAGSSLVGVTVGHNHNHRLCKALLNEVVQDLGSAAHGRPGFLISTGAVQEVKNGVLLLGIVLVTVGSVNGETTVHTENVTVIPRVAHGAVLLGFAVILRAFSGDDEHGEETGAVTLNQDVLRVVNSNAVYYEVVGVDFRLRERNLHRPDIVFAAEHVDGAAPGVGHPGTTELHNGGVVCLQTEGYAVVLNFGGNDGFHATAKREVGQFLCLQAAGHCQADCESRKNAFH